MHQLAIVIPAYKSVFLAKTLESLAAQTSHAFNVYIGNDAGDGRIEDVVNSYIDRLNICYHAFDSNLGSVSLVRQWQRCFALTQGEQWLWLLPDDDYIDPQCVENFYRNLEKADFDLFRFNVHFVTTEGVVFKSNPPLPPVQDAFESLMEKLSFLRPSTVAEYIFRREKFEQFGFAEIPLAWGSDDLLWYRIGKEKGICSDNAAFVYLRQSHLNISNNYSDLASKKVQANFWFFKELLHSSEFKIDCIDMEKRRRFEQTALTHIMFNLQDFSIKLSGKKILKFAIKGNEIWGGGVIRNIRRFYLNNKRISN
jgi:hypothetical protein